MFKKSKNIFVENVEYLIPPELNKDFIIAYDQVKNTEFYKMILDIGEVFKTFCIKNENVRLLIEKTIKEQKESSCKQNADFTIVDKHLESAQNILTDLLPKIQNLDDAFWQMVIQNFTPKESNNE